MNSVLNALRDILGVPNFYVQLPSSGGYTSYGWDYGAMIEYFGGLLILLVVVSSIFRFICNLVKR